MEMLRNKKRDCHFRKTQCVGRSKPYSGRDGLTCFKTSGLAQATGSRESTLSPSQQWINWISCSLLCERLSDEPFQSQVLSVLHSFWRAHSTSAGWDLPLSTVESPLCPSAGCAILDQKAGRNTGSLWSLIQVKAAFPASKQSLGQIPCLTQSVQYLRNWFLPCNY